MNRFSTRNQQFQGLQQPQQARTGNPQFLARTGRERAEDPARTVSLNPVNEIPMPTRTGTQTHNRDFSREYLNIFNEEVNNSLFNREFFRTMRPTPEISRGTAMDTLERLRRDQTIVREEMERERQLRNERDAQERIREEDRFRDYIHNRDQERIQPIRAATINTTGTATTAGQFWTNATAGTTATFTNTAPASEPIPNRASIKNQVMDELKRLQLRQDVWSDGMNLTVTTKLIHVDEDGSETELNEVESSIGLCELKDAD